MATDRLRCLQSPFELLGWQLVYSTGLSGALRDGFRAKRLAGATSHHFNQNEHRMRNH